MSRCFVVMFTLLICGGCSSYRSMTVEERESISPGEKIYKIETISGELLEFEGDPLGYAILKPGGIERLMPDGTVSTIPINTVERIYTKETSVLSTAGSLILISAVAGGVLYLLLGSINVH